MYLNPRNQHPALAGTLEMNTERTAAYLADTAIISKLDTFKRSYIRKDDRSFKPSGVEGATPSKPLRDKQLMLSANTGSGGIIHCITGENQHIQ